MTAPAPATEAELLARARRLAGRSLAAVAAELEVPVPPDLRRHKGWVGHLVERALGATAASRAEPDFPQLGVELKTLPVDARGRPRESTWVCTAPLADLDALDWETSPVRHKLARVLWVPVQADPAIPLADRRLGSPLMWTAAPDEERALRDDWVELTDVIRLGQGETLTAHHGEVLQVRPKAANARERKLGVGPSGWLEEVPPLGFYLRARFTAALLARHYALPA